MKINIVFLIMMYSYCCKAQPIIETYKGNTAKNGSEWSYNFKINIRYKDSLNVDGWINWTINKVPKDVLKEDKKYKKIYKDFFSNIDFVGKLENGIYHIKETAIPSKRNYYNLFNTLDEYRLTIQNDSLKGMKINNSNSINEPQTILVGSKIETPYSVQSSFEYADKELAIKSKEDNIQKQKIAEFEYKDSIEKAKQTALDKIVITKANNVWYKLQYPTKATGEFPIEAVFIRFDSMKTTVRFITSNEKLCYQLGLLPIPCRSVFYRPGHKNAYYIKADSKIYDLLGGNEINWETGYSMINNIAFDFYFAPLPLNTTKLSMIEGNSESAYSLMDINLNKVTVNSQSSFDISEDFSEYFTNYYDKYFSEALQNDNTSKIQWLLNNQYYKAEYLTENHLVSLSKYDKFKSIALKGLVERATTPTDFENLMKNQNLKSKITLIEEKAYIELVKETSSYNTSRFIELFPNSKYLAIAKKAFSTAKRNEDVIAERERTEREEKTENESAYQVVSKSSNTFVNVQVKSNGHSLSIYSRDKEDNKNNYYSSITDANGFSKSFNNSYDDNTVSLNDFERYSHYPLTVTISYQSKGEIISATIKIFKPSKIYAIEIKPLY